MVLSYNVYPFSESLWIVAAKEKVKSHIGTLAPEILLRSLQSSYWFDKIDRLDDYARDEIGDVTLEVRTKTGLPITFGFYADKRHLYELGELQYISLGNGNGPDIHQRIDGEI